MPRKVKLGTGITAYEITMYDVQEEGLPQGSSDWNQSLKEHGYFGTVARQAEQTCELITAKAGAGLPTMEDSPEAFARLIGKLIRATKNEIARSDADRAARFAFRAGTEWARAAMKWAWEDDAFRGEKVAGGERNAAHQTNARHAPPREKRFARMRELVPRMGPDKAAACCEVEGLGTRVAIKRQWNRWQKKRDT